MFLEFLGASLEDDLVVRMGADLDGLPGKYIGFFKASSSPGPVSHEPCPQWPKRSEQAVNVGA